MTHSSLERMKMPLVGGPIPGVVEGLSSGDLLIDQDVTLPESVKFEDWVSMGEWILVSQVRSAKLDRQLNSVGWHFFSFPPEIETDAVALDRPRALAKALRKLLAGAEAARVNALEITNVRGKEFLALRYASLRGCMRHIQQSPFVFQTAEEAHERILRAARSQHVDRSRAAIF